MSGGRAPHPSRLPRPSSAWGRFRPLMTDPALVALSLLPMQAWRDIRVRLRAGDSPATVLDRLLATRWPADAERRSMLMADATAALARGRSRSIASIDWNDRQYPPW